MRERKIKTIVLAALLMLGSSAAFASGIGKVTSLEGKVDIFRQGCVGPSVVSLGTDVSVGDSVRTKSGSKAEITFSDKSVVRLAEKTKLDVVEYAVGDDGKRISAMLNVERGKIRAIVSKSAGKDDFIINTPNASGSIKGTDVVVVFQKSSTAVAVLNGKYSLSSAASPEKELELKSGEVSVVAADDAPSSPRSMLASEKRSHESDTSVTRDTAVASRPDKRSAVAEGYSQPEEVNAVVVKMSGSVRIKNKDSRTWHDAKVNEMIKTGDSVETKANGRAEFKLDNGNIITLQQNSNVTLSKISQNDKGEYENLFESTGGKLRAQVEKLKGNSKFEVKTPNAVACVRGTVLFLNILPNLTNSYFEEGNGVLRSLISGTVQNVPMGTSSAADNNGNLSLPAVPSDEQRSQWHEGWEFSDGVEGYSGPEGYTGGGTNNNENPGAGTNNVFSDKPFTEIIGPSGKGGTGGTGTGGETGPAPVTMNGTIEGTFGYEVRSENNFFDMILSSTAPLGRQWSGVISMTAAGTYANPYDRIFTGNVEGTGVNGGAFYGWSGGIMHSWDTVVTSIYIDPSGLAGNLFGVLSGSNTVNGSDGYYRGGMFGNGDMFVIPMAQLEPDVEYGTEYGWGHGNLSLAFDGGQGFFDTGFDRRMMRIEGQDWGIWREAHYGMYYNPNGLTSWNAVAGGDYNDGYFFTSVEGSDNLNGGVRMDIIGSYLDRYNLGAYYGTLLAHAGEGIEGTGGGAFIEQALSSSSSLYNCAYDLYDYEYYEGLDHAGHIYGLAGTVGDLWSADGFLFTSIGGMDEDETGSLDNFVWTTDFISENSDTEQNTTYGDEGQVGAYYGLSSVTGKDGAIKGSARIIYINPDGYAGVKSGRLNGAYSALAGAYIFEGDFADDGAITPVLTGIDPANLSDMIWTEVGDGRLAGDYSGEGYIGGEDELYSASIVDYVNHTAYNWGIYNQKLSGSYELPETTDVIFSAKMGGNDAFGCYNPALNINGQYQLSDGGYYYYEYRDNNGYGYTSEYHFVNNTHLYEQTYYYNNGEKYTYTYSYDSNWYYLGGTSTYDTWVTSVPLSELIGSEPADASYMSYESSYGTAENDYGYWVADVNGQGEGWFEGSLNGMFLTGTRMGTISGDLDGAYYDDGTWMGSGSGVWNGNRLTFSGYWGESARSLYSDGEGWPSWAGEEYGLMGSTAENWWDRESFQALAMGDYWSERGDNDGPIFWNTEIVSHNVEKDNYTTLDDGAFYGFTNGIWKNGLMSDGRVIAFFAAPDGRVGLLRGGAGGEYYDSIDMWKAMMNLSPEFVEGYSIAPEDLRDSINEEDIGELYIGGSFVPGMGTIYDGSIQSAYSYSIGEFQWGIFDMKMGGYFDKDDGLSYENGLALGNIEGYYGDHILIRTKNIVMDGSSISADVFGAFINLEEGTIGKLSGYFRGVSTDQYEYYYDENLGQDVAYYTDTSWAGSAIGEWRTEALAYSSMLTNGGFGYFDSEYDDFSPEYGQLDGVFGGSGRLWDGPADFSLIGGFWNPDYNEDGYPDLKLWASDFFIITDDNAVAYGTIGGTSIENRLKGLLLSLYIRETDQGYRAGYIMSVDEAGNFETFSGDFYPSLEMFGASGTLAYFLDLPTKFEPSVLLEDDEALDYGDIYGVVGGDISGTLTGESMRLLDQDWGVWRTASGGTFEETPEGPWKAVMGDVEDEDDGYYSTYTLVFLNGKPWDDGGFEADISGNSLSPVELVTINGRMLGAYDTDEYSWEALGLGVSQVNELYLSGITEGWFGSYDGESFRDRGYMCGNIGGIQENWWANGPFNVISIGTYEADLSRNSYLLGSEIVSYNAYEDNYTTVDGNGSFLGWSVGGARNGKLSNIYTAAIFISPKEDGYQAGIIRGRSEGNAYAMPSEYIDEWGDYEVGMWKTEGTWTPTVMMNYIDIEPYELYDSISVDNGAFNAYGNGTIGGNTMEAMITDASTACIGSYDRWGIVSGILAARSDSIATNADWRTALGGVAPDEVNGDSYLLLTAYGTNGIGDAPIDGITGGNVNGAFRGIFLGPEDWNGQTGECLTFRAGRVEGDLSGFYETGEDTTFQAAFVGEWVDLAELSTDVLGFNNVALAEMVSVPITETYTALLQGNGSFGGAGAITGNMDISFYAQSALDLNGIWAALFNGNYSGYTGGNDWSLNYSNESGVQATLTGTQWNEGQWVANVSGTALGEVNFSGQAGGTYTGAESGNLEGVGAGTWNQGPQ